MHTALLFPMYYFYCCTLTRVLQLGDIIFFAIINKYDNNKKNWFQLLQASIFKILHKMTNKALCRIHCFSVMKTYESVAQMIPNQNFRAFQRTWRICISLSAIQGIRIKRNIALQQQQRLKRCCFSHHHFYHSNKNNCILACFNYRAEDKGFYWRKHGTDQSWKG